MAHKNPQDLLFCFGVLARHTIILWSLVVPQSTTHMVYRTIEYVRLFFLLALWNCTYVASPAINISACNNHWFFLKLPQRQYPIRLVFREDNACRSDGELDWSIKAPWHTAALTLSPLYYYTWNSDLFKLCLVSPLEWATWLLVQLQHNVILINKRQPLWITEQRNGK